MLTYVVRITLSRADNIADFHVESIIDEMHKGIFRSDTQSNWHRKHKQHHTSNANNDLNGGYRERLQRRKWSDQYPHWDRFGDNRRGSSVTSSIITNDNTSAVTARGVTNNNRSSTLAAQHKTQIQDNKSSFETPQPKDNGTITGNTLDYNANNNYMKKVKRKNANHIVEHCAQEYWYENLYSTGSVFQFKKKWSYNRAEHNTKTVSFR